MHCLVLMLHEGGEGALNVSVINHDVLSCVRSPGLPMLQLLSVRERVRQQRTLTGDNRSAGSI